MSEKCMVCVDAGVCKMKTLIIAQENDMGLVDIEIKSDCPNILKMSWRLQPMSPYCEVPQGSSRRSRLPEVSG